MWKSQGSTSEIEEFVSSNLHDEQPSEVVTHGIDALIGMEADSSLQRLGSQIGGGIPQSYAKKLAEALNERSILPASSSALCEGLVRGDIADNAELDELLERHDETHLGECAIETASSIQEGEDLEDLYDYLYNVSEYNFEIPRLVELSISNLESKKSLEDRYREISDEINEIERDIEEEKESKESIKDKMDKHVRMRAYMVGLVEKASIGNIYEIAKFDRYGNVSRTHAYLITKETSFKSKGRFSMVVKETGSVQTELKDEYGGFNQNWKVYVESELPDNPRERIEDIEEELSELESEKNQAEWKKSEANTEMSKVETNIEEVFDGDDNFDTAGIAPLGGDKYKKSYGMSRLSEGSKVLIMKSESKEKLVWSHPSGIDTIGASYKDTYFSSFLSIDEPKAIFYTTTDQKYIVSSRWTEKDDELGWVSKTRGKEKVETKNAGKGIFEYLKSYAEVSDVPDDLSAMSYSEARRILVASGWRPYPGKDDAEDVIGYPGKDSWDEVESCSQGAVYCNFKFRNAFGETLKVTTQGEAKDPVVVGWDKE